MDYGLFNIKQFIMLDSGVANSSLTIYILATVANHIFDQEKALFNLIFQNFPRDGQHAKMSTFSKKAREKVHFFPKYKQKNPIFSKKAREKVHFRPEKHPPKSRPGYGPE